MHLFISCEVAKEVWPKVLKWWSIQNVTVTSVMDVITLAERVNLPNHLIAHFDVVVQSTLWFIWRFRNEMTFSLKRPTKDHIFNDIKLASFNWISCRARKASLNWSVWFDNPRTALCN